MRPRVLMGATDSIAHGAATGARGGARSPHFRAQFTLAGRIVGRSLRAVEPYGDLR